MKDEDRCPYGATPGLGRCRRRGSVRLMNPGGEPRYYIRACAEHVWRYKASGWVEAR